MTRVIHTGDTHVGYRQYHSPERREDFREAFAQVIEDAIAAEVDAVIHAGDLFHDRQPSLLDVHGAIEILRDLRAAGIPFLAVVGNHERTRDRQWLDLFETLDLATRLGREPETIGNTDFYGLDFVPRSKRDDLNYEFDPGDGEHAALVSHGLFEPFPHANWDTEAVIEESTVDFDVLLLGDNHAPDRAEVRGTWVTYPGSTERAEASEREARGYNIVEFDDGVSIRRRGLDTREFVTLDIELDPGEGAEYVRERLREEVLEDAVVIVTVEGEGGDVPAARIEEFATERGALLARVNDRREFDDDAVPDVRFADPDEAVRKRLREMGPSQAALDVDETIRDRTVADSNVRDRVTGRVEALIESGADAFETAGEIEEPGEDEVDEQEKMGVETQNEDAGPVKGSRAGEEGTDGATVPDGNGEPNGTGDPESEADANLRGGGQETTPELDQDMTESGQEETESVQDERRDIDEEETDSSLQETDSGQGVATDFDREETDSSQEETDSNQEETDSGQDVTTDFDREETDSSQEETDSGQVTMEDYL